MTVLNLNQFTGMVPRRASALLPNVTAQNAVNSRLLGGTLKALRQPNLIASGISGSSVSRLTFEDDSTFLYTSPKFGVDIIQAPILGDSFDRFYKFNDGIPQYNTADRIKAGQSWFDLGVPEGRQPPSVTVTANVDTTLNETRVYTYTLVSEYGEESAPAETTTLVGDIGANWNISILETSFPLTEMATRNITKIHIYRTVTGFSTASLFRIATISIPTSGAATFVDNLTAYDAAQGSILNSTTWQPPPSNLEGAVVMPNGFLIGWAGKNIYMSEAYRPHAWPTNYQQAIEFDIIGLGVFGQSVVAATQGSPYIGSGVTPTSLNFRKTNSVEPCLSRRSIVSTLYGVVYASPNGLVLVNGPQPQIVTKNLLTKYEWQEAYNPDGIIAAPYYNQYLAFFRPNEGFIFDPSEPASAFIKVTNPDSVIDLTADNYTGEVLLLTTNSLYTWDAEGSPLRTYTWRSKEFVAPKPLNFGAARITFEGYDVDLGVADPIESAYNIARIATPLAPIGQDTVGGSSAPIVIDPTIPENRYPLAGSPLLELNQSAPSPSVTLRVYVENNGVQELKLETSVSLSEKIIRMPASFKATRWVFELEGQRPVQSLKIASTARELRSV